MTYATMTITDAARQFVAIRDALRASSEARAVVRYASGRGFVPSTSGGFEILATDSDSACRASARHAVAFTFGS